MWTFPTDDQPLFFKYHANKKLPPLNDDWDR